MKRNNLKLFLIALIFIIPVVVSHYVYDHSNGFHFKTMNHGVLVSKPFPVKEFTSAPDKRQWQIVYMPAGACDKQCDTTMFTLHQLRKAIGKNHGRINLVFVTNAENKLKDAHDFQQIIFNKEQYAYISNSIEPNFSAKDKIYLIDPLGNLFMYYPSTTDQMNILKDLKRLLEVSQIG